MIPKGGIPGSIRSVLVTETAVSLNQLGGNYARVQVCLQSVYCPLREEAPRCGEFTREFLSDYLQQCNGAGNENSLAMYHRFTIQNWTIAGHFYVCLRFLFRHSTLEGFWWGNGTQENIVFTG